MGLGVDFFNKSHDNSLLGRNEESPSEILRIFTEAGGNAKQALVGHIESKQ